MNNPGDFNPSGGVEKIEPADVVNICLAVFDKVISQAVSCNTPDSDLCNMVLSLGALKAVSKELHEAKLLRSQLEMIEQRLAAKT